MKSRLKIKKPLLLIIKVSSSYLYLFCLKIHRENTKKIEGARTVIRFSIGMIFKGEFS
jgi:hypothetical protein